MTRIIRSAADSISGSEEEDDMTKKNCGCSTETCGCCEGTQKLTPRPVVNRPGLSELRYRVGTHGAFLETMKARLSDMTVDVPDEDGKTTTVLHPLSDLTAREPGDPSVAMLDSWAMVADVLTFYQERIANEGYLRTATERLSILELARLVGYTPRPGVASTVYLAYTLDEDRSAAPPKPTTSVIPKGSRAQSIPGPGEQMQSFETSEDLEARSTWNCLQVRLTRPQTRASIISGSDIDQQRPRVYLKGISTNLKPNDPLLIQFSTDEQPAPYRVEQVLPDAAKDRTLIVLRNWGASTEKKAMKKSLSETSYRDTSNMLDEALGALEVPPLVQPANALGLGRDAAKIFARDANSVSQVLTSLRPRLKESFYSALKGAEVTEPQQIKVYALRVTASLFGHNAQLKPIRMNADKVMETEEWTAKDIYAAEEVTPEIDSNSYYSSAVYLDAGYDKILTDSWIVVDSSAAGDDASQVFHPAKPQPVIATVGKAQPGISRSAYGISGKTTRIELMKPWIEGTRTGLRAMKKETGKDFQLIRRTVVYAQSEELPLAEEAIEEPIGCCKQNDAAENEIVELNGLYDGLESGRWLIVSGERIIEGTSGVRTGELVMISAVNHSVEGPTRKMKELYKGGLRGDKIHTFLQLAKPLAYCYKRDTVTIYGNVVKATHGETRSEVMGGGDSGQALQSFTLKQPPVTFVPASNPEGVDSSLEVYVNDVEWHETDTFSGLTPKDRKFITKTDDDGKTTVVFGNGKEGSRLPTGMGNVKAVYRSGIGKPGNVKAEQISLLATKPLNVKAVINPLRASGGADKDTRDQARENAPLAVMSLDRLVSVQDYADFARTFAGIGKAVAGKITDGTRQLVHVTIAGIDDVPIDDTSDLYTNLLQSLRSYGDPYQPLVVQARELVQLVLNANIRISPDYQWEPVVTEIRSLLLENFGFQKRALGQSVYLSEIIATIQAIRGVEYTDVDSFGGIPEKRAVPDGTRRPLTLEEIYSAAAAITRIERITELAEKKDLPPVDNEGIVGKLRQSKINLSEFSRPFRSRVPGVVANLADFERGGIRPAQLAIFTTDVPDTIILNQIK